MTDSALKTVFIYDLFGTFIQKIESDLFEHPMGMEVDIQDNIYVADPEARKIIFIDQKLENISEISFPQRFRSPRDIAVLTSARQRTLFVIDGDEIVVGQMQTEKQ